MAAVLSLCVVIAGGTSLLAQDGVPAAKTADTHGNDPELLKTIVMQSRANLGKIQDWRGRARLRLKRINKEATDGKPTEQAATVLVTFVYNLNRADIHADCVLEDSVNLPDEPGSLLRDYLAQCRRFSPVCWQFPMKENIIGSSFTHFHNLLRKEPELPKGKISRSGSVVRVWIGRSEDWCNVYEVDLDKGASLVKFETRLDGKVTSVWRLEPQLLDDIWIPLRTTCVNEGTECREEETIEWFENEINEIR